MKYILFMMGCLGVLMWQCSKTKSSQSTPPVKPTATAEFPVAPEKGIIGVLSFYYEGVEALAADDFPTAQRSFKSYHAHLMLPSFRLQNAEQTHADAMSSPKEMHEDLTQILEQAVMGEAIEDIRSRLNGITYLTRELIHKSDAKDKVIYMHYHCPMVSTQVGIGEKKKDGYWLSREDTLKNPYYGAQMLHCGGEADTARYADDASHWYAEWNQRSPKKNLN